LLDKGEGLVQVSDNIIRILSSNTEPYQLRRDVSHLARFLTLLLVG
jgi:hypothetical protein